MARFLFSAALLVSIFAGTVFADGAQCGPGSPCPESAPCCSEYGFCGSTSKYCLGGCNPLWSHALDSCRAMPICQDKTYTFSSTSIVNGTTFDGNATAYDWTADQGMPSVNSNNELVLILTQDDRAPQGSRVSSTDYVLYGTITATLKTGKWDGVVTAFITMSNVKDEIDWEWPGNQPTQAQTNYFFLGNVDYTAGHGATEDNLTDTNANYHDYTIDWQPETLTFSIDGNVVRTVNKADTLTNGVYQYPTTPARFQLSIWPGGLSTEPQGVITWAGGLIQWNEPEYTNAGNEYQVFVQKVAVQCSTQSNLTITPNTISYMYGANDTSGIPTVYASNQTTLLNSAPSVRVPAIQLPLALALLAVVTAVFAF